MGLAEVVYLSIPQQIRDMFKLIKIKLYKIKKSNIDNKGLIAAQDIKKGTRIIEYKGKLISKKESDDNPKFDNSKRIYIFDINERESFGFRFRHVKFVEIVWKL